MVKKRISSQLPFRPRFLLAVIGIFTAGLIGAIFQLHLVAYGITAVSLVLALLEVHKFLMMKDGNENDG